MENRAPIAKVEGDSVEARQSSGIDRKEPVFG